MPRLNHSQNFIENYSYPTGRCERGMSVRIRLSFIMPNGVFREMKGWREIVREKQVSVFVANCLHSQFINKKHLKAKWCARAWLTSIRWKFSSHFYHARLVAGANLHFLRVECDDDESETVFTHSRLAVMFSYRIPSVIGNKREEEENASKQTVIGDEAEKNYAISMEKYSNWVWQVAHHLTTISRCCLFVWCKSFAGKQAREIKWNRGKKFECSLPSIAIQLSSLLSPPSKTKVLSHLRLQPFSILLH